MSTVAFFDSGIGGMSYLQALSSQFPRHNYYYYADTEGFPYGIKSEKWITKRLVQYAQSICSTLPIDVFVIACNTASVVALEDVRRVLAALSVNVVGVEPAIKLAVDSGYSRIYVMSTGVTASSVHTIDLARKFVKDDRNIMLKGIPTLVTAIENMILSPHDTTSHMSYIVKLLHTLKEDINAYNADAVVLACTHFLYISTLFQDILKNSVSILDSLPGVIKRISSLLVEENTDASIRNNVKIYITSHDAEELFVSYAQKNMMSYEGVWKMYT